LNLKFSGTKRSMGRCRMERQGALSSQQSAFS
jgi:hypothetical protein